MERSSILECSFSSWYPRFKDNTIKSRIIKIPEEVLQYLHADGIILPESSHGIYAPKGDESESDDEDQLDEDWGDELSQDKVESIRFPEFDEEIRKAIKALGGTVFPKLNWSSPKDASWIAFNHSLACTTPADIYLLLKSSTFVAHDLTNPFEVCQPNEASEDKFDYELILRRWHNLNPAGEFRCFVKDRVLFAICQRHNSNYFEHIVREEKQIRDDIVKFFKDKVNENFPDSNYVFDVYRNDEGKVYLLDFNPFCSVTDGLMFNWEELHAFDPEPDLGAAKLAEDPEFLFVLQETGIQGNPYQHYAIPQDFVDLSAGIDHLKLLDFIKMSKGEESSSDDEETDDKKNDEKT